MEIQLKNSYLLEGKHSEAATQWCFTEKVLLKFPQKSLEDNCVAVLSCRRETSKFIKNETPTQLLFEFFWDNSRGCFSNI